MGVADLQIAATAWCHSDNRQRIVVVHYDKGFDVLAAIEPTLLTQWIVPQGSVT